MSVYGIKIEGFEDPSFGFEDPSFGFEDPSFGYKDGELSATLSRFVGKKAPATLRQDSDVLQIQVGQLNRPVRLVPEDKEKARGLYKLFAQGAEVNFTVKDGGGVRRGAENIIVLTRK